MASQEPITPWPGPQGPFKIAGIALDGDGGDGPRRLYFERGEERYAQFAAEDVVNEWTVSDKEPPFYEGEEATVVELAPGAHVDYVLGTKVSDQFDADVQLRTTGPHRPEWGSFSEACNSRGMHHTCYRC